MSGSTMVDIGNSAFTDDTANEPTQRPFDKSNSSEFGAASSLLLSAMLVARKRRSSSSSNNLVIEQIRNISQDEAANVPQPRAKFLDSRALPLMVFLSRLFVQFNQLVVVTVVSVTTIEGKACERRCELGGYRLI